MTLNTASKIEWAFNAVTVIIALPFALIAQILEWIKYPFVRILDLRNLCVFKVGHKLMHISDAVKDGTIKNSYCLKHYTARAAWRHLKEAKRNNREAEI